MSTPLPKSFEEEVASYRKGSAAESASTPQGGSDVEARSDLPSVRRQILPPCVATPEDRQQDGVKGGEAGGWRFARFGSGPAPLMGGSASVPSPPTLPPIDGIEAPQFVPPLKKTGAGEALGACRPVLPSPVIPSWSTPPQTGLASSKATKSSRPRSGRRPLGVVTNTAKTPSDEARVVARHVDEKQRTVAFTGDSEKRADADVDKSLADLLLAKATVACCSIIGGGSPSSSARSRSA